MFRWSASNSRIVELLHAFVRACYDPNMPLECLDNRLNVLMGDEFRQRDERKEVAKKNRDESLTYRPPKHLDRKSTQQMQGKQILAGASKYSSDKISSLPQHVKDQIKIRTINKDGHTTMEKKYQKDLQAAWEERRSKKLAKSVRQLDLDELQAVADATMSVHDKTWNDRGDKQYTKIVEKVATKEHFKKIPVKDDAFVNEIIQVLPFIGYSLSPQATNTNDVRKALKAKGMNKTSILGKGGCLGVHLDLVKAIAKGKADNSLPVDISDKTEDEILQVFVRADLSFNLNKMKEEVANQWKCMENIFESAAREISPRFLKLMNKEPKETDESNESDSEDESDGEEMSVENRVN